MHTIIRTTLAGAAACVLLTACAPSLLGPTVAHSDDIPTCTDSIADSGGVCQGVPEWETPVIEDERDEYTVTVPSPRQLGTPATDDGQPFLTEDVITEDDPRWDCRFDGNEACGVEIEGVWYVIQFRDGSPEGVTYR